MAAVWAARLRGARGFTKLVAIKTMLPGVSNDPDFERMFLDEAGIASRIRHPNVVETLELGEEAGLLYIVMEWIDGESLDAVIKAASASGGLPLPIALKIARDACLGVHAAHELRDEENRPLGLVHRDVSPPNLLITYNGLVKLADFGVAKVSHHDMHQTHAGVIKGKFRYMAPEQFTNTDVDRRTDVFSLGIILYQLTTGKHPWSADTSAGSLHRMFCTPPPPPRSLVAGYPPELERTVLKALALEPAERFQTATELAEAVRAVALRLECQPGDRDLAAFLEERVGMRGATRRAALRQAAHDADAHRSTTASMVTSAPPGPMVVPAAPSSPETAAARPVRSDRFVALGLAACLLGLGYFLGTHGATDSADAAVRPAPATSYDPVARSFPAAEDADESGPGSVAEAPAGKPAAPRTLPRPLIAPLPRKPPPPMPPKVKAAAGRTSQSDEPDPDVGF
jgi:serine/threonine-protein kinase